MGKVGFVCNVLVHVEKSSLSLVQSDTWPCWLKLQSVTFAYQEGLLPGIIKRKCSRLVSYGIFYFNKACSCKILTRIHRKAVARYFLLGLATYYRES